MLPTQIILDLQDKLADIEKDGSLPSAIAVAKIHGIIAEYLTVAQNDKVEYDRVKDCLKLLKAHNVAITCKGGLNAKKDVLIAFARELNDSYQAECIADINNINNLPLPVTTATPTLTDRTEIAELNKLTSNGSKSEIKERAIALGAAAGLHHDDYFDYLQAVWRQSVESLPTAAPVTQAILVNHTTQESQILTMTDTTTTTDTAIAIDDDMPEMSLLEMALAAQASVETEPGVTQDPEQLILLEKIAAALTSNDPGIIRQLALTQGVSDTATDLQCKAMLTGLKALIKPVKGKTKTAIAVDVSQLEPLPTTKPGESVSDKSRIMIPRNGDKGTVLTQDEINTIAACENDPHEYGKAIFKAVIKHGCVPVSKALDTTDGNIQRHAAVVLLLELSPIIRGYFDSKQISWAKLHYITTNSVKKHSLAYFEKFVEYTVITGENPRLLSVALKSA